MRKDVEQMLEWRDPSDQSGVDRVLAIITRFSWNEDESGELGIEDLIMR